MSLMESFHDHSGLPGSILTVLVALLLLLAGIIWVAFCIALYRAAQRVAEIKRQRRRQHIIAAALNRAVNQQSVSTVQAGITLSFPTSSPNDLSPDDLPSYEEAIQEVPPPPEWHKVMNNRPMTGHDSLRIFTNTGLLRVAPERPSSSAISRTIEDINAVSRHPPSYETATRLEIETEF